MNKFFKMIFLFTLLMSTMISISSYTWLGTWIGLEINLMSFIPLLKEKFNSNSSESSIKYFLIQTMASAIFLLSILIMMISNNFFNEIININNFLLLIINSSLLMKMGAAPFYFWFIDIIENLNWMNSLLIMTWQKIAPMMLISYTIKYSYFIILIIIFCTFFGSIGGLNQISMRKILAFSSINHMGWMISSFMINDLMWILYFSIYMFISLTLIYMLNLYKIFYLKQIYMFMNKNTLIKFFLLLNLLSLGGLPPFLGFLPKWMIIQYLNLNYPMLLMFMILMSLITLFFYLRIMFTSMIMINNNMNFKLISINNKFLLLMMIFISMNGLIILTFIFNYN